MHLYMSIDRNFSSCILFISLDMDFFFATIKENFLNTCYPYRIIAKVGRNIHTWRLFTRLRTNLWFLSYAIKGSGPVFQWVLSIKSSYGCQATAAARAQDCTAPSLGSLFLRTDYRCFCFPPSPLVFFMP